MKSLDTEGIGALLQAWSNGDEEARDRLVSALYEDLRRRAARYLKRERQQHSLQTTALVHETYLRMAGLRSVSLHHRNQFFAMAARMMRNILVDRARRRSAAKRGGAELRVSFEEAETAASPREVDVLLLDGALLELNDFAPRQAHLVELRYFGGLSVEEAAKVLEVSPATVKREWNVAKAWLYRHIQQGHSPSAGS